MIFKKKPESKRINGKVILKYLLSLLLEAKRMTLKYGKKMIRDKCIMGFLPVIREGPSFSFNREVRLN
ncbi:hypothetical protein DRO64_08165 [Candidatus Bathyarchaeota archaeon]|nr:MAG: hypothetical protein DRO64_08165 [Candidatus Bathyarchaeota archaeon]